MIRYSKQKRLLAAVDCIVFGFDGVDLKILLIQRGFEPQKGRWSLMGGFVQPDEDCDEAATRILKQLTGLGGVYLEQLHTFCHPQRDPIERTISIAYFALIDINKYQQQLSKDFQAAWFSLSKFPHLIFDHPVMVKMAREKLKYKAALHPILFELLPPKFTLPQLQGLYELIYDVKLDKRNFSRKVLSTGLITRQNDKDRESSKKGAFYYKINKAKYRENFQAFLNIIPHAHHLL